MDVKALDIDKDLAKHFGASTYVKVFYHGQKGSIQTYCPEQFGYF